MIQRIQTVYLLLVSLLNLAVLFFPLAIIRSGEEFYTLDATGFSTMTTPPELVYPTWALIALIAIISLIALITIFLYKKRMLQIRFCIFNSVLMLAFYGLLAFLVWKVTGDVADFHFGVRLALAFPLIALILNYLAIRNIGADEVLVRSLNRLR